MDGTIIVLEDLASGGETVFREWPGNIVKINSLKLNGQVWVVLLYGDGMLKLVRLTRDHQTASEHFEISLNAVDLEVSEKHLLIKYVSEHYALFAFTWSGTRPELKLVKCWRIDLKNPFQTSNISKMHYRRSESGLC